jgi:aminoglycoside phosphotransferase family enzyme/predicted kinase
VGDTTATLIESLKTSVPFPHAVTSIEIHETHISWVVLTGPFAYKIKKPVNLGFCDFTSLARRRFFCEEELRLNRRLAPDLYLDVLPICGTAQSPRIGGTDEPLEWCVRMRQFEQDCLMTRVVDRGLLAPSHVDALARQIAEFHAKIPIARPETRFGTPAAVAEPIRANFEHLDRLDSPAERGLVKRLSAWCEAELQRLESVLAARKAGGFIRECHGDMHLGNMILEGDVITIFDCIEFNESLRWIDVMSELAFCTMDLEDHRRPDFPGSNFSGPNFSGPNFSGSNFSGRFLNASLEWSGDYAGLAVFPLYFTYRALVRAKVAQIRRSQASLSREEAEQAASAVSDYLNLASRSVASRPQFLAITHGLSGSGKTWGTQAILERSGAIRLRSDVERKRLAGLGPLANTDSDISSGLYTPAFNRRTFARLAELGSAIVNAGFPLIVDATFLRQAEREQFRALADALGVPFAILDFPADEATCRERIRRRAQDKTDASEATEQVLERQLQLREPLSEAEQRLAVRFDPARPEAIDALIGRPGRAGL